MCVVLNNAGVRVYPVYIYPLSVLRSFKLICLTKKPQVAPVMPLRAVIPILRFGMVLDKGRPEQQQGSFG